MDGQDKNKKNGNLSAALFWQILSIFPISSKKILYAMKNYTGSVCLKCCPDFLGICRFHRRKLVKTVKVLKKQQFQNGRFYQ
jgi:hypothetical protein